MRTGTKPAQRGQAAIEFVFALIFIIGITTVLFQVLNFELDVFNQSMLVRYEFMDKAHESQDTTPCKSFNIPFAGKKIGDLAPYEAPYQAVDENLRYGTKRYYGERGTKYVDNFSFAHDWGVWWLAMNLDHYEGTAGNIDDTAQAAFTLLILDLPFRGCD